MQLVTGAPELTAVADIDMELEQRRARDEQRHISANVHGGSPRGGNPHPFTLLLLLYPEPDDDRVMVG
jgi:hypothetical protein